jgi:spore coat protein A, manganese oxidase
MLIPPVMPRAGTIRQKGGKNVDYYEISMRQFAQQILPAGLPATTVWGYGAVAAQSKRGLLLHNAPSLTIEASVEPAGADQVDQRAGGRQRQLPAPPAAGRPHPALGQPTRWGDVPRHAADLRRDPGPTPDRCRW